MIKEALKRSAAELSDRLIEDELEILSVPKTFPLYYLAIDFNAGTIELLEFYSDDTFYRQLQRSHSIPEFFLIAAPMLATNHSLAKVLRGGHFDTLLNCLASSIHGGNVGLEKAKADFASKVKCYHGAADEAEMAEQLVAKYVSGEIPADANHGDLMRIVRDHMKNLKAQKIWIYPRFIEAKQVLEELKAEIEFVEIEKHRWHTAA